VIASSWSIAFTQFFSYSEVLCIMTFHFVIATSQSIVFICLVFSIQLFFITWYKVYHLLFIISLYQSIIFKTFVKKDWFLNVTHLLQVQAMKRFIEGNAISVLDPRLDQTSANNLALEKILELALQCLAPHRQSRPNMKRCAEVLWAIRKDYREISASNFRSYSTTSQRSTSLRE
jgi:hypothetical protein